MKVYEEKYFRILIADEHIDFRNKIASRLRVLGFHVEFATGGFHLLHILEKNWDYNLVIIHDNMADMPAIEIISLVRNNKNKFELPIMFIADKGHKDQLNEIGSSGANDYILKSPNLQPIIDKAIKYFTLQKNNG